MPKYRIPLIQLKDRPEKQVILLQVYTASTFVGKKS